AAWCRLLPPASPYAPDRLFRRRGGRCAPAGHRSGDDDARGDPALRALRELDLALGALRASLEPERRAARAHLLRTLSADWVGPVEGPPIEQGAIAIGDDGRIAAVGTTADLGEGEHFEDAVILPGFVNAHSHIEYA